MASYITELTPLSTLYIQIEYGNSPATLLGVGSKATEAEIREAYLTFALKIHPDKASPELRRRHTKLFQEVQAAYDTLIEERASELQDHSGEPSTAKEAPKQLPESWASVHARNADSRAAELLTLSAPLTTSASGLCLNERLSRRPRNWSSWAARPSLP